MLSSLVSWFSLDILKAPFQVRNLWKSNSKVQAVTVGTLVVAKTAGALVMWYNPWLLLKIGLPIVAHVGPVVTSVIIKGIQFAFV